MFNVDLNKFKNYYANHNYLQISSDQPLCKSEKESSTIRNGLKEKVNTVVLLNSQLQQDAEKVKIVVSADESRSAVNETNPSYNSMTTVAKEPRRSIAQGFFAQTKNPFKRKDKKGRRSSDKRKMDQREMRATIRMVSNFPYFSLKYDQHFAINVKLDFKLCIKTTEIHLIMSACTIPVMSSSNLLVGEIVDQDSKKITSSHSIHKQTDKKIIRTPKNRVTKTNLCYFPLRHNYYLKLSKLTANY